MKLVLRLPPLFVKTQEADLFQTSGKAAAAGSEETTPVSSGWLVTLLKLSLRG